MVPGEMRRPFAPCIRMKQENDRDVDLFFTPSIGKCVEGCC